MADQDVQAQIVAAMRAAFPPTEPAVAPYYAMMQYHLGWLDERLQPARSSGGKLVRPLLVLLSNRIFGGTDDQALPLAAGIQLLHDFSLIHDDIEDNSATRRGRTTAWTIWGVPHAINAGDGMFALAHRAIHGLHDASVAPQRVLGVLRDFEETVLRICEGQYLDMSAEGSMDVTVEQYLQMIRGKTAMLTAAATGLGAQLATDDEPAIKHMWEFGEALGLAFQMQDDLLDIWGDPAVTGKPFAADLVQRKMSLPVIYGLAHASGADREQFTALYRRPELSRADLETLMAILDRSEARDYIENAARSEYDHAIHALDRIAPQNRAAFDELHALGRSLLKRVS